MNSTFISNSELTNQAKPPEVLNRTHLLLCLIEWCYHRHFIANNCQSLKLAGNPEFARSNKMLESKLKAPRREGKENVQHKAVIESQDLIKLNNWPFHESKYPCRSPP